LSRRTEKLKPENFPGGHRAATLALMTRPSVGPCRRLRELSKSDGSTVSKDGQTERTDGSTVISNPKFEKGDGLTVTPHPKF